jgi:hypothetical protein
MPTFEVRESFALESRNWFVLAGQILEGEIRAGMVVLVPMTSLPSLSWPIRAIEFLLRSDGREDVCLCLRYDDERELSRLSGWQLRGEVLWIVEPGEAEAHAG